MSRACAHAILDEMDEALRDLDNESASVPSKLDAVNVNKGLVLIRLGRSHQARAAFEEVQDLRATLRVGSSSSESMPAF